MMMCDAWSEDLSAWIDGELDSRRAREIAQHLQACEGCRGALAGFQHVTLLMKAAPRPRASRHLTDPAMALVRKLSRERRGTPAWRSLFEPFWPKFSLALSGAAIASLLAIIVGHNYFFSNPYGRDLTDNPRQESAAAEAPVGPSIQSTKPTISGELAVADSAVGADRVATLARALGGDAYSVSTAGSSTVFVTVPPTKQGAFINGLSGLGKWQNTTGAPSLIGPATIGITVVQHP